MQSARQISTDGHDKADGRFSQIYENTLKPYQLMLYRVKIVVCFQTHTKHMNTAVWEEGRIYEC